MSNEGLTHTAAYEKLQNIKRFVHAQSVCFDFTICRDRSGLITNNCHVNLYFAYSNNFGPSLYSRDVKFDLFKHSKFV